MSRVERILNLPADKRAKEIGRQPVNYEKRSFTEDELVSFLKHRSIRSSYALRKQRSEGEPSVYDYTKTFGSWAKAVEVAFGDVAIRKVMPDITPKYILQVFVQFNVKSYRDFLSKRSVHPDVFPTYHRILKEFGSFGNIMRLVDEFSVRKIVERYLALKKRLGKKPSRNDCRIAAVDIDEIVERLGGKSEFDGLVDMIEAHHEKEGRGSSEIS